MPTSLFIWPGLLTTDGLTTTFSTAIVANTLQSKTLTTVAGLPAATSALEGTRASVTDALAPAFGVALVGGGAVRMSAYCTGAAWVAI